MTEPPSTHKPATETTHDWAGLTEHVDAFKSLIHPADVTKGIHGRHLLLERFPFLHKWVPGIENLASKKHWGNFVAVRGTDKRIFESMPIYAR
jgi:phosphatidylserine decarboxylase